MAWSPTAAALVVRNTFSTRRLARSEIADFRLDRLRFALPNRQAIRVVLRDGKVRTLDVTKGFRAPARSGAGPGPPAVVARGRED